MRERLVRLIDELPDKYRNCVLLYYYERLSFKEIAGVLGVTVNAVDNNLRMARNVLRLELENELEADGIPWDTLPMMAMAPVLHGALVKTAETAVTPAVMESVFAASGVLGGLPYLPRAGAPTLGAKIAAVATAAAAVAGVAGYAVYANRLSPPPAAQAASDGFPQGQSDAPGAEGGDEIHGHTVDGYIEIPEAYAGSLAIYDLTLELLDPAGRVVAATGVDAGGLFRFEGVEIPARGLYTLRVREDSGEPLPVLIPEATIELYPGYGENE